jgi:hypothetical protein
MRLLPALSCLILLPLAPACDKAEPDDELSFGETGDEGPACDSSKGDGDEDEDLSLCEQEGDFQACEDGESLQYCTWAQDDMMRWGECIPGDECTPGQQGEDEVFPGVMGCEGMYATCVSMAGVPMWDYPDCATPLMLNFDDKPITFTAYEDVGEAAEFAVSSTACVTSDWPAAATPWLVLDRDGSGTIDGGTELFGSGTTLVNGRKARNGFDALAELDDNRDGRVDASDAKFAQLMLWADINGDRQSQALELTPLAERDIESLSVEHRVELECDERGNCGRERAAFEMAGERGSSGEIVDVYVPCR